MRTNLQTRESEPHGHEAAVVAASRPDALARDANRPSLRTAVDARRVLIVSSHFPPERGAGVHRILRIVRQLGDDSWPVTVLTIDPRHYRPGTPVDDHLLDRVPAQVHVYRTGAIRGIAAIARWRRRAVGRIASWLGFAAGPAPAAVAAPSRPAAPAKRPFIDAEIGWFLPAIRQGTRAIARHKPDVVFSSAPPFTCHLIAGWLARRHGLRWVADFRDPWARSPWGGAGFSRSWRGRLRRRLERLVVERADAVVLNTQPLRDDFARHYGPTLAAKFHAVTNGYDAEVLAPYVGRPAARGRRLVLTHAGSLYRRRDPRPLLHALAAAIRTGRVPADGLELHFVGSVSPEFRMAETVRELQLESSVRLTPSVPHQQSLECLAAADVLVVIQPDTHLQVPVKLYEYLPFEKPILALAPKGALSTIVEESGLGLVVEPEATEAVADALSEIYAHRDRLGTRFRPDTAYIRRFDGTAVSRQLQHVLETV